MQVESHKMPAQQEGNSSADTMQKESEHSGKAEEDDAPPDNTDVQQQAQAALDYLAPVDPFAKKVKKKAPPPKILDHIFDADAKEQAERKAATISQEEVLVPAFGDEAKKPEQPVAKNPEEVSQTISQADAASQEVAVRQPKPVTTATVPTSAKPLQPGSSAKTKHEADLDQSIAAAERSQMS